MRHHVPRVAINRKGTFTVPKEIRDMLHLVPGDRVIVTIGDDEIHFKPLPDAPGPELKA